MLQKRLKSARLRAALAVIAAGARDQRQAFQNGYRLLEQLGFRYAERLKLAKEPEIFGYLRHVGHTAEYDCRIGKAPGKPERP